MVSQEIRGKSVLFTHHISRTETIQLHQRRLWEHAAETCFFVLNSGGLTYTHLKRYGESNSWRLISENKYMNDKIYYLLYMWYIDIISKGCCIYQCLSKIRAPNHHWQRGNLKNIPQVVNSMLMDEHDPSMLNQINHYRLSAIKTRLKHWSCHALSYSYRLRVLKFHKCHRKTITHTQTHSLCTYSPWSLESIPICFYGFPAYVFSSPKKGPGPKTFQHLRFFQEPRH